MRAPPIDYRAAESFSKPSLYVRPSISLRTNGAPGLYKGKLLTPGHAKVSDAEGRGTVRRWVGL